MKAPAVKFLLCSVAMLMMISVAASAQVNGALQTTLSDGTIVNFNVKPPTSCDAIYITGGAQNTSAAGISPSGTYYFRVTDPSGNTVLTSDLVTGDTLNINSSGRITGYTGTNPGHLAGDTFNPANGETTVLLWPFAQTPNNGGVYKAWISTTSDFTNSTTKTDNFKCVQPTPPCTGDGCPGPPPPSADIIGTKFYDANANGVQDAGELGIANWLVSIAPDAQDLTGADTISCSYTGASPAGQYDFTVDPDTLFTITEGTDSTLNSIWHHTTATSGTVTSGDAGTTVNGPNFGNVCLGGNGGGLTLGFWSNKNGQAILSNSGYTGFNVLNSLNLVNAVGTHVTFTLNATGYAAFRTWILGATATNMAYMLSAQLAAMELNVYYSKITGGSGAVIFSGLPVPDCFSGAGEVAPNASGFISLGDVMNDANLELLASGGNYTVAAGAQRSCEEYKKTALDGANNNLNFPQPDATKCPAFGFDTSNCAF